MSKIERTQAHWYRWFSLAQGMELVHYRTGERAVVTNVLFDRAWACPVETEEFSSFELDGFWVPNFGSEATCLAAISELINIFQIVTFKAQLSGLGKQYLLLVSHEGPYFGMVNGRWDAVGEAKFRVEHTCDNLGEVLESVLKQIDTHIQAK